MKRIIPILFLSATPCVLTISCASPGTGAGHGGRQAANQLKFGGPIETASKGRRLFLKNCAHCHGTDAHGDEGPDLHNLDWTDEQIITRIRNGKKGQMKAFAGKLPADDIEAVVVYLRTLN